MRIVLFTLLLALGSFSFATIVYGAQDSTVINLEVLFCNHDLICDPEENYSACPSDCVAPTPPVATTTEDDGGETTPRTRRIIERIIAPIESIITLFPFVPEIDTDGVQCDGESCTTSLSRMLDRFTRSPRKNSNGSVYSEGGLHVATQEDDDAVVFLWNRGQAVRILRSQEQFPQSPFEGGTLIFEGATGFFEDSLDSIADNLYYALFAREDDGSYGDPQLVLVKNSLLASPVGASQTMSSTSAFGFAVLGTLITILIVRIIWFLL